MSAGRSAVGRVAELAARVLECPWWSDGTVRWVRSIDAAEMMLDDLDHPLHGTLTGYDMGCRCPRCRAAMSAYQRGRGRGRGRGEPGHGRADPATGRVRDAARGPDGAAVPPGGAGDGTGRPRTCAGGRHDDDERKAAVRRDGSDGR